MSYQDPTWRAARRIRLDVNNLLQASCGQHGLTVDHLHAAAPAAATAVREVSARRAQLGWPLLPHQDVSAILQYAEAQRGRFDNFVVLGIGGSALGNLALQTGVNGPFYNSVPASERRGPRLIILDNSDPEFNYGVLQTIDLRRTLFNVISKSGTTGETMASFLFFRDALARTVGEDRLADHFVLTTDPQSGFLRTIGQREGWAMFDLPPLVGGRFSVLTPVGLLSGAMTGIDIHELLAGAAYGAELAAEADPLANPAALGALGAHLLAEQGKNIYVMMPYANRLRDVADWFAQLWAESLGKSVDRAGHARRVGQTPVKALGATDQHSQVQLYMEGPHDKLVNFLAVERYTTELPIPTAYSDLEGVSYLGGHTFAELIQAEQQATSLALSEAGQPNMTHIFPEISAFTIGQFFMLMEMQTAIAGELLNINAFDQPGVEAGKVNTYALLGRSGFEARRAEIASRSAMVDRRWIV